MRRALAMLVMLALGAPAFAAPAAPGAPAPSAPARRPLHDAGHALRTFGADAWFLGSSPARMGPGDALALAGLAGVTAVLVANDEAILAASLRNHDAPVYAPVKRLGYNLEPLGLMGNTLPWTFGAMLTGYAIGHRELTVIPAEIIESHFLAGGVRNLSKLFIGRRRPFENRGPRAFEFDGGTSFPSGHTSVVFEVATILSEHARRWPVTVTTYALATTVAIQRVDSRNHWASDVLVPAVSGTLIARALVERHRAPSVASAGAATDAPGAGGAIPRPRWGIAPAVTPAGGAGWALGVTF